MCAGEFCGQQDYKIKSLFSVYRDTEVEYHQKGLKWDTSPLTAALNYLRHYFLK